MCGKRAAFRAANWASWALADPLELLVVELLVDDPDVVEGCDKSGAKGNPDGLNGYRGFPAKPNRC